MLVAMLILVLSPPLVLGAAVLVDRALRARGRPSIRRNWWIRVWWWYGYHGLYQAQRRWWWLRAGRDNGPRCSSGHWTATKDLPDTLACEGGCGRIWKRAESEADSNGLYADWTPIAARCEECWIRDYGVPAPGFTGFDAQGFHVDIERIVWVGERCTRGANHPGKHRPVPAPMPERP